MDRSFAPMPSDLALLLSYAPTRYLPLPFGFAWRETDWWTCAESLTLECIAAPAPVPVAVIENVSAGCWRATTNLHRTWAFVGKHLTTSRLGAIQFLVGWAERNARSLLAEAARRH